MVDFNACFRSEVGTAGLEGFIDFFDSRGMDRSHSFFGCFRPDDHDSIAAYKDAISKAYGPQKAEEVLKRYGLDYMRNVPVSWDTVEDYFRIGNAFLQEPENSGLWALGKLLQQKATTFWEANKDNCPESQDCEGLYNRLVRQRLISEHQSLSDKVLPRLKEKGAGYVIGKIWDRTSEWAVSKIKPDGIAGVSQKYFSGDLNLETIAGATKGFSASYVSLEGNKVGVMIIGDPSQGARVSAKVRVGGIVTEEEIEKEYGNGRLMYQGVLTMQSTEGVPLGSVVVEGRPHQIRFDAERLDGLVIAFPDGTIKAIDKRLFRLSDITGDDNDRSVMMSLTNDQGNTQARFLEILKNRRATLLSGVSFDPHGKFAKWNNKNGDSNRRMIFTFKNGMFGVFNSDTLSTNEMLALIYRLQGQIGELERVIMCDRGGWDTASMYINGTVGGKTVLSNVGTGVANRIIFYSKEK